MAQDDRGGQAGSDGRLRTALTLFMGALVALIALLVVYDFWQRRAQTLDEATRRAENVAHILAQHLERSFAAADATLAHVALQGQRLGGPGANPADWRTILEVAHTVFATLGSISVVDADGVIRHSTSPGLIGQSRATRPIFMALREARGDAMVADAPVASQREPDLMLIPLGRRLEDASGRFAGIVVATFVPERLRDFYKSVEVGAAGEISILHSNGTTIFSEPPNAAAAARADDRAPVLEAVRAGNARGALRAETRDGARMIAFERTAAAGVAMVVSFSEDEVLAGWRHDAVVGVAVMGVLALALVAAMLVLRRELVARRQAEERLIRAQKMEAIGQLTGGIAHDFNNLLTVIVGCSDDLADSLPKDAPQQRVVAMISAAGDKAASLTRQLLAFSRRQVLQPVAIDVNQLVSGMGDLLRRTLGEEVEIEFALDSDVLPVTADPAQLESAVLNLAINARDAMRGGGKLTIETANATLDANYARHETDVWPGQYVLLAVSDTGMGMTPEVAARAFDPFFTTKAPGRGTGLGLSMVFGFVKQSEGHVKIYSELGHGTTIKIYLPARGAPAGAAAPAGAKDSAHRGAETVLVVEDDQLVRDLVMRQLGELGYTVIVARDGPAAMAELAKTQRVDLLFTDVVLPGGLSGRDLATRARGLRPGLRVLYTSGYTANSIVHHGRLDPDVKLLQKPFTRPDLAKAVREALEEE